MNHDLLESRLNSYFEREAGREDISEDQWQRMVSVAVSNSQCCQSIWRRIWVWNLRMLSSRRPLAGAFAAVIVALVAVGVSLWMSELWQSDSPGRLTLDLGPGGVTGVTGRPARQYLDMKWSTEKSSYVPGESITVELNLTNIQARPIKFSEISTTPLLDNVDTPTNEMIPLTLAFADGIPELIQPLEELVLPIKLSSAITSPLPTGRYTVHLDLSFSELFDSPEPSGETTLGLNSGTLFVIAPPEGALVKTVQVGEARQATGITMTLVSLSFAAEETKIVMTTKLPVSDATAIGTTSPNSQLAPVPTSVASKLGEPTPAPTATPAPRSPDSDLRGAGARYRIDGGAWQELGSLGHGGSNEAVYLEWTMGPVSSLAQIFEFAVTGVRISPDTEVAGPWEWTVSLK